MFGIVGVGGGALKGELKCKIVPHFFGVSEQILLKQACSVRLKQD